MNTLRVAVILVGVTGLRNWVQEFLKDITEGKTRNSIIRQMKEILPPLTLRYPMSKLLTMMRIMDVTDPRDRIFSMLALTTESEGLALKPDYVMPYMAIYIRTARHLLCNDESDGLLILEQAQHVSSDTVVDPHRPSWVPDWTKPRSHALNMTAGLTSQFDREILGASGQVRRKIRLTDDILRLYVSGGCVGKVERLIHRPQWKPAREVKNDELTPQATHVSFSLVGHHEQKSADRIKISRQHSDDRGAKMLDHLAEIDDMIANSNVPYVKAKPGETNEMVQIRTLLAYWAAVRPLLPTGIRDPDYVSCYRRFRVDLNAVVERIAAQSNGSPSDVESAYNALEHNFFCHRWLGITSELSVRRSTTGLFGLVPRGAQPGDELWVLLGGSAPFLLRPSGGENASHRFIGACYLHGLMAGEALEDPNWTEEEICLV